MQRKLAPMEHGPTAAAKAIFVLLLSATLAACGGGAGEEQTGAEETADAAATEAPETATTEAPDAGATDGPGGEPTTAASEFGPITVAMSVPQSVVFLPADLGVAEGVFSDCGLDVENVVGDAGTVGPILASGEADMILHLAPLGVGQIMAGLPAKVVANQTGPWGQVLIVSNELADAGIQDAEDLRAQAGDRLISFGISAFGSGGHLSTLSLAEELGWTEGEEYDIVPLGGVNEITAGLESGVIDAFAWSPEVAYTMETTGVGHVIPNIVAEAVGPTMFEAFVASDAFIEERPEALKAYLECHYDYVEELQANPEQVTELAVEHWDKNREAMELSVEQIVADWSTDGSATEEQLAGVEEATVFLNEDVDEASPSQWWSFWQDL